MCVRPHCADSGQVDDATYSGAVAQLDHALGDVGRHSVPAQLWTYPNRMSFGLTEQLGCMLAITAGDEPSRHPSEQVCPVVGVLDVAHLLLNSSQHVGDVVPAEQRGVL